MASNDIKNQYKKKFNMAYEVNNYVLIGKLMKITDEYETKMNYHLDAGILYKLMNEFNEKKNEVEKQKKELYEKYKNAISSLDKSKNIDIKYFDKLLFEMTLKDHTKYSSGSYFIESMLWKSDKRNKITKEYTDKCSKINNIVNMVIRRLNEAYKLYESIQLMKKLEILRDINDSFVSLKEMDEQIALVSKYEKYSNDINEHLAKNKKIYDICINVIDKINKDKMDLDTFKFLEKDIQRIITKEYLPILNDSDEYSNVYQEYKENMPLFFSEESKYKKRKDKYRKILLESIKKNSEELMIIDAFNKKKDRKRNNINVNTSLDMLYDINKEIIKNIKEAKNDAINYCYEYIIYFYASNDILESIPSNVYSLYTEYIDNKDSEVIVNNCYKEFVKMYFNCLYNANYDLETTVSGNYVDVSREVLFSNIERMKRKYLKIDIQIPQELLDIDSKKEDLDIISLYQLYVKLERLGFKFFDYEEIKFKL